PTPGLGFSVGFERIVLALEAAAAPLPQLPQPAVYIASVDKSCRWAAIEQAARLRDAGIATELDHQGRSLKSQFKAADRLGVDWVVVIGPDELASGQATLRDMAGHDERQVALADLQATLTAIMLAQEE
ncbi:MAG: His/Gly/Thr/Pro-type tRNA ligase C-terminal domain-containing protein, partial [Coriobacteriia bacterium]|nr:His/Gly/Thr/Pro-type tRNA ligase C-terminal domain-containing protein [Coriobacteriia bacterium]